MENYEVMRLVGEGSFGRVFQAKQKADSRIVALKVISKVRSFDYIKIVYQSHGFHYVERKITEGIKRITPRM